MFICQWHLDLPFGRQAEFRAHAEALAPLIIAGSRRWEVLRVVA